jgi:hypothetical protein
MLGLEGKPFRFENNQAGLFPHDGGCQAGRQAARAHRRRLAVPRSSSWQQRAAEWGKLGGMCSGGLCALLRSCHSHIAAPVQCLTPPAPALHPRCFSPAACLPACRLCYHRPRGQGVRRPVAPCGSGSQHHCVSSLRRRGARGLQPHLTKPPRAAAASVIHN